jgi:hypothetical protein
MKNLAKKSLDFTSLFEAEIFVWLMLKAWQHPLADDKDFVNWLLESASEALHNASKGQQFIVGLPATDLNFVAAVWYAESCAVQSEEAAPETLEARKAWLTTVRRTLPSCFCNPDDLVRGVQI